MTNRKIRREEMLKQADQAKKQSADRLIEKEKEVYSARPAIGSIVYWSTQTLGAPDNIMNIERARFSTIAVRRCGELVRVWNGNATVICRKIYDKWCPAEEEDKLRDLRAGEWSVTE